MDERFDDDHLLAVLADVIDETDPVPADARAIALAADLSGLDAERIDRVVDALRGFEVDYLVPQHCTGAEAFVRLAQRMGPQLVVSSTGSTFTFGD